MGGPLLLVAGVASGIWWLILVGFVLAVLWVLQLRVGVERSDGRVVVVQNSFRRYEVVADAIVGVDGAVRFWNRAPHLELEDGERIRVGAFGVQRWLARKNDDAIDLAEQLDVAYRAG